MRVLFRVDASVRIGSGHVMRCVTLAEKLRQQGAMIAFACRELPGDLNDWLRSKGFEVLAWIAERPEPVEAMLYSYLQSVSYDWLVVDHYGLDAEWEKNLRPLVKRLLVIDDLANRPHDCDLLLDQNFFAEPRKRYAEWLPEHCEQLLGPEFALLRPAFLEARQSVLASGRREVGELKRIQVFFGGSDPTEETLPILQALDAARQPEWAIDVIVGASNPLQVEVRDWCTQKDYLRFFCQTPLMASLMGEADLAISAGGTATWERLCVGLPALVISVAVNQEQLSEEVAAVGAQIYLGPCGLISRDEIAEQARLLSTQPERLRVMSEKALALVDGQGTDRVSQRMIAMLAAVQAKG